MSFPGYTRYYSPAQTKRCSFFRVHRVNFAEDLIRGIPTYVDLVDPEASVTLNPTRLCKAAKAENVRMAENANGVEAKGDWRGYGKGRDDAKRCKEREITARLCLGRLINSPCENINFN